MVESTPILRDILLDALRTLPGTREFHIHVLQSSPRRNTSLFQFAKPRPRTYVQDILVLLSEQATNPTDAVAASSPRVLVTAIEGNLYHIPSTSSAILYVCKVDSTGQTSGTSPTRPLVRAFLNYYANPATRPVNVHNLWIQLFARAQGQYLFPNSAQFERKRPLSDVKLCAWWKRLLSQVAIDVGTTTTSSSDTPNSTASSSLTTTTPTTTTTVEAYYVLPGYSQLEAEYSLKVVSSNVSWEYGHPYTLQKRTCFFPCPLDTQYRSLGHYIPYFDDDPKSRFLDEIAYTTAGGEVKSPVRKRARTATSADDAKHYRDGGGSSTTATTMTSDGSKKHGNEKEKDDRPLGELWKVTPDEFWERMSFRQECVAGAVTGFFTLVVSTKKVKKKEQQQQENEIQEGGGESKTQLEHVMSSSSSPSSLLSPLEPQRGQVSSQINKRILTALTTGVEFSTVERAIKATETLESAIQKLCEGITSLPNTSSHSPQMGERSTTPEPKEEGAGKLTLVVVVPPSTPPPPPARRNGKKEGSLLAVDVTPNPFPEPVASLETYQSYIYGMVAVSNCIGDGAVEGGDKGNGEGSSAPVVTVLTARKKKKRME